MAHKQQKASKQLQKATPNNTITTKNNINIVTIINYCWRLLSEMHIKEIVVDGFKSYAHRTVIAG